LLPGDLFGKADPFLFDGKVEDFPLLPEFGLQFFFELFMRWLSRSICSFMAAPF